MIKKSELHLLVVLILLRLSMGTPKHSLYQHHAESYLSQIIPTERACQVN